MQPPSVGQIVNYFDSQGRRTNKPLAALITAVNDNGTINVCVWDSNGATFTKQNITLYEAGSTPPGSEPYCCAVASIKLLLTTET